ncbi:MAG: oligopeptide/dipeptide ABC transporter ATP-binding protein, partial [Bacteroidota bacterium]
ILAEVQKLATDTGTALIWITHDLTVVASLADRVAVMYAGKIVEMGATGDVLDAPRHPYTVGLIGSVPSHNARGAPLAQIKGMTPSMTNLPEGCSFGPRCPRRSEACREMPDLSPVNGADARCHHPHAPSPHAPNEAAA